MSTAIEVLMIDNDEDNFLSLQGRAAKHRIILKYAENLPDAMVYIKENKKVSGIIIDGKGFIERNQAKGTDKEDFVHEALSQIKLLEAEEKRYIPKVVLTAWYDQLKDSLESRVRVFDKKKIVENDQTLSEFFEYIKEQVKQTNIFKIRDKYNDVFNIVNNSAFDFSEETLDAKMFSLLSTFNSPVVNKTNFNLLRDVFENILIGLKNIGFLPQVLFYSNGKPDQAKCLIYIYGNDVYKDATKSHKICLARDTSDKNNYVPEHIIYCLEFVKQLSNSLSHIEKDKWTNNVFNAGVASIIEILLWIDRQYLNI
jgi:hypothetical protein